MTLLFPTRRSNAPSQGLTPDPRANATKRLALGKGMSRALCALVGLAVSLLVAATGASATPLGESPFAPGSVVVTQGGTIFGGTNAGTGVELNGDVDVYPPSSNGDVPPVATLTNAMYGPTTMVFDSGGDLWLANENTSDIFELTKAQLGTPNPEPAVTIFAAAGALANPFGMAFDSSGNLWVVSNAWNKVYEYTNERTGRLGRANTLHHDFGLPEHSHLRRRLRRLRQPVGVDGQERGRVLEGRAGDEAPGADTHNILERWRTTYLRRLRRPVDRHRWRSRLLRHPLYQRGSGVHQGAALEAGFPDACRHDPLNRAWQPHRVPVRPLLARLQPVG